MSVSNTDYEKLNTFLTDANADVIDVVRINLEFLVEPTYHEFISEYREGLDKFEESIGTCKDSIDKKEFVQGLIDHGLVEKEFQRKLNLYYKSRKEYYLARQEFYKAGIDFWDQIKKIPGKVKYGTIDAKRWAEEKGRKVYNKFRRGYNKFKEKTGSLLGFIDLIVDSIGSVVPGVGVANEFKKSAEIATKKREHNTFYIMVINLTPELIERMREQMANQPLAAE